MTTPLWTSTTAAAATSGRTTEDWAANGVSIDTRTLNQGDLFIALSGPNFDGHDFVGAAFDAGAAAALVEQVDILNGRPGLIVQDTMSAMCALGINARERSFAQIAAITGSVGKTGTKEALAHVLSAQGNTSFSQRNLNNHWGVPLSLARLQSNAKYGIFEIGMNHPGEIKPLARLVRPHVAVVTAIASAHREFFDSVEAIAHAKGEIFASIDGGIAIINRDTEYFSLLSKMAKDAGASSIISFGQHLDSNMRLIECIPNGFGSLIKARWQNELISYQVSQPGVHWAHNSLAVLATADALGAEIHSAAKMLATLPPMQGRGAVHVIPWGDGTIKLIDDSYNASPESMSAALETLGSLRPCGGRRVAVMGDMLELGDTSRSAHLALKKHIEKNDIDTVFLVGTEITALTEVLHKSQISATADTADALLPSVLSGLRAGDIVIIKASNGIGLDLIVSALTKPEPSPLVSNQG
ncbi:MAG: UDP-N-acetylmuramoyl-tripeptide--D-alanyl-D-alanine ligase [Pseudomonadota bacterium]|nr:UDP-N-acetylmuramoyl-tripeptide--D-alanyl-D-alanine ligase [Pseudomonadota bacterium]